MIDSSAIGAKLVLLRSDGTEETCFDFVNELTIGRGTSCDVSIKAKVVSRKHAAIRFNENGQFILHHLSETNPSAVNGMNVIGEHTLKDSDMVTFGDKIFQFRATDPNRYSPAVSRTTSAGNKHLPVLETIKESSPNVKEDISTGKPSVKGLPNSIMVDIQKRRKSAAPPVITTAKASPGKPEASKATKSNEAKKIPFSIKEAIEKRRVSLTGATAISVDEASVKPPATTPRKSVSSSAKAEDESVVGAMRKISTPLRRAINARLDAEKMSSPLPAQKEEEFPPSSVLQPTTPREKKVIKSPTPLRMSIVALRRKSLPAARPESAKKDSTPAEPEKLRLALPTPVREQIRAARMSISYSEVVPSARRQASSPERRTSTGGRRLLFEQLPFLASSPGAVASCPRINKARKSLRQSLSDAATIIESVASAEELFQEDCLVATSVQISALTAVQELSNEFTSSEEVIERAVAAILSPSVQSCEQPETSSSKRVQTPSELKAFRRASDASVMSSLSAEEIAMVEQYSEMLPKEENAAEEEPEETGNFAVALDAYVRGIECAQNLTSTAAATEEVAANECEKSEAPQTANDDFPCLSKLFTLPASFVDATYAGFDEDLVELYAQEIMEAANVDEAVAYGVALDSFLADPVLFRNHIGALALPHLIYMHHEEKQEVEDIDATLPEDAMEVDEIAAAEANADEIVVVEQVAAATEQSFIENMEEEEIVEEPKDDNTTRIAIEFIGTTPASSRYPSRRTTIQASTEKSTVKKSVRKSIAFADSSTPAAPHSVQKELEVEEVKSIASRSRRASKLVVVEPQVESEAVQPTLAPSRATSRRTSRAAQSLILSAVESVAVLTSLMEDEAAIVDPSAMEVDEASVPESDVGENAPIEGQSVTEESIAIEEISVVEEKPVVAEDKQTNTKKRSRGGKASKPAEEVVIVVEPVVTPPVVEAVVAEDPGAISTAMETEVEEIIVEVILCDKCDGEFTLEEAGLDSVPEGDWFCTSCEPKKRRGGRVPAAAKPATKKLSAAPKKSTQVVTKVIDSPAKRGGRKATVVAEPEPEPEVVTARATRSTRSKKA